LDLQSSILDPRSSILDPRSSILDPRSSILDPRSSILDPQSSGRCKLRVNLHRSFQLIHHFQNLQLEIAVDPVGSQKLARLIERLPALLPADERVEPGERKEDLPLALPLR